MEKQKLTNKEIIQDYLQNNNFTLNYYDLDIEEVPQEVIKETLYSLFIKKGIIVRIDGCQHIIRIVRDTDKKIINLELYTTKEYVRLNGYRRSAW